MASGNGSAHAAKQSSAGRPVVPASRTGTSRIIADALRAAIVDGTFAPDATLHHRGERYFPQYKRKSDAEHAGILAAVKRGAVEAAQSRVTAHLLGTGERIHRFLTTAGEPSDTTRAATPRRRARAAVRRLPARGPESR